MTALMFLLLAGFSGFLGILMGATSIGAVLLVPFLRYFGGIDVHVAIDSAMFSYIFSGAAGVWLYARRGSIPWSTAGWLVLGAMPGAFLGSMLKSLVPGLALEVFIGLLLVFAGYTALRSGSGGAAAMRVLAKPLLVALGAFTGVVSALSGTGGPVTILPLLLWLKVPVLAAIGLAQAIQLPIALLATGGNVLSGKIDFLIGSTIAVALVVGMVAGASLAHALSPAMLKRGVAWFILIVGIGIFAKLLTAQFS